MDVVALADVFLDRFMSVFSKPQFENFKAYEMGLFTVEKNRTVNRMANENDYGKDQSSLNRFVTQSPWLPHELRSKIREQVGLQLDPEQVVYEIVDDSVTEKFGKKMEDASWNYSAMEKQVVFGHDFVTLFIRQGDFASPADLRLYVSEENAAKGKKPFKTKIEMAEAMLRASPAKQKRITLFDAWYACEDLFRLCSDTGRTFVARLKENRVFYLNGKRTNVELACKKIFRGNGKPLRVRETDCLVFPAVTVPLEDGRVVRLAFAKRLKDGAALVVASNDLDASAEELVKHYSVRFDTETFYRDAKQNLGLGEYRFRKSHGVLIHGLLVVTAYLILALVRISSRLSAFVRSKIRTFGDVVQAFRTSLEQRLVQAVHDLTLEGLSLKEIYGRIGLTKNAKH